VVAAQGVARLLGSVWTAATTVAAKHRTKLHCLVGVGGLALARPNDAQDLLVVVLLVFGLGLRTWALGCISKNRTLCTWGPYKYTRNPLYLANVLIAAGLCVLANHWVLTLACAMVFALAYPTTMRHEEKSLDAVFGREYRQYCAVTPRFIPHLRPASLGAAGRFRWSHAVRQGLVCQTVGFVVLLGAVEAKEEYMEARGVTPPGTYGVLPLTMVDVAASAQPPTANAEAADDASDARSQPGAEPSKLGRLAEGKGVRVHAETAGRRSLGGEPDTSAASVAARSAPAAGNPDMRSSRSAP